MSIRITKNGQQKGQSPARGGSKVGTCSKTGLFLVTASMPDVGIVPPPSDERSPQFCCVWPVTETERDCGGLVVEDTSINGVACQVLKNSGGKEDRELSACLLLPLLPEELKKLEAKALPASARNSGSQSIEQLLAKLNSQIFDSRGSSGRAAAADQQQQTPKPSSQPSPASTTPQSSSFKQKGDKSSSSSSASPSKATASPVKPRQLVKTVTRSKPTPTLAAAAEPKSGASSNAASTSMATTYSKFSQFEFVSSPGGGGGGGSFLESKMSTFSKFSQYSTASPGSCVSKATANYSNPFSSSSPFSVSEAAGSFASSKATTYSKYEQKSFKKKTPQSSSVKSPSGQSSKHSNKSNSSK